MSSPLPADRARARREAAKRLHPDRGGDPEEFDRAMKSFDAPAPAIPGADAGRRDIAVTPRSPAARAAKALRTTSKTLVADVRRRLPRSFPGSRRYGHL